MSSLIGDGGFGAMAGVDLGFRGEGEQLGAYAIEEAIEVAAGQIGTADGAAEECIACDDSLCSGYVKADAGGGMTGRLTHFKLALAEGKLHAGAQFVLDGGEAGFGQVEHLSLLGDGLIEIVLTRVHPGIDAESLFHLGQGADVIEVGVGDEDALDANLQPFDLGEYAAGLIARVHNEGFAGVFVGENRAILLEENPHRDDRVNHTL